MSVDYSAGAGIGYEITKEITKESTRELIKKDWYDEIDEFIRCFFDDSDDNCKVFEVGEGSYTGDDNELFLVTKTEIDKSTDLKEIKKELDSIVEKYGFVVVGEFGLHWGLEVH